MDAAWVLRSDGGCCGRTWDWRRGIGEDDCCQRLHTQRPELANVGAAGEEEGRMY